MIDISADEIQEFFFKAMQENGYSEGGQKIKIPDMPGYKALPFRDGDFSLLDCWCVTPHSQRSAGTTTIWYKDDPVWWMRYNGWYTEEGILFLKRALRITAENKQWFGGRGPLEFDEDGLEYRNHIVFSPFSDFLGYEDIFDRRDLKVSVKLGYHAYSGFAML